MAASTTSGGYQKHGSDFEERARNTASDISDKASELTSKAGAQVESAIRSAERTAQQVADQGREAGERVTEVAGNFKSAVDKSVREQPLATLAIAAGLGFVVGALWKS
ncbi:MAG: hypothetical protein SFW09_11210 [Hyphomicrobiaceae bacterium]|nr:hypothetical protein [Hyphomicrobiaceae bacterium]